MADFSSRLERLSPGRRALLARWLGRAAAQADATPASAPAGQRLVAYVVPHTLGTAPGAAPDPADLRRFLQDRLPDYMVPSAVVLLDALPRTPNGKVDRNALPDPDAPATPAETAYEAPRTPVEAQLAALWSEVLGLELVGIHDNFFEVGGDSILSIQILAKANQAGLRLTARQLFEHQTIAALAAVAGASQPAAATQGLVTGSVALTPIQHWFFEQDLPDRHHWSQVLTLDVDAAASAALLEQALQQVYLHHDALRLRYRKAGLQWLQHHAPSDPVPSLTRMDLSALAPEAREEAVQATLADLNDRFDLAQGPLMGAVLFEHGVGRPRRLAISVHHLLVDIVSWQLLAADLAMAYDQLRRGEPVALPAKTSAFKQWAEVLQQEAGSPESQAERSFWLSRAALPVAPLPVDAGGPNSEASGRTIEVALGDAATRQLLHDVPPVYHVHVHEVLLAALAATLAQWTGALTVQVDLEGHGREPLADTVDVSRTVGWFTTVYPLALSLETPAPDPGALLKSVKEQLRRVPRHGIGYGLLRYLGEDAGLRGRLQAAPRPEVLFNYAGQFHPRLPAASPFLPAFTLAPSRSPRGRRPHQLEINAAIADGLLRLRWTHSTQVHHAATIEQLARAYLHALQGLIDHCLTPGAGGYTPSDFPEAGLSQEALDDFLNRLS